MDQSTATLLELRDLGSLDVRSPAVIVVGDVARFDPRSSLCEPSLPYALPLALKLDGAHVLVIGAGEVGVARPAQLLEAVWW